MVIFSGDVDRIIDQIQDYYPHEAARRPRWQDGNLHRTLLATKLRFSAGGLGRYAVRANESALSRCLQPFPMPSCSLRWRNGVIRPSSANGGSSIAPLPTAWRKRRTLVYLHAPAAEPMAQRVHHQCNRVAARRIQAKDQDANRTAVSSRRHAVLGAACLWTDQHAQGRWMANARRKAQQSAD